jgi:hypothetical protein
MVLTRITLRGAVGELADLAVVGGDRGGVDAHPALALVVGLVAGHLRRGEAQRVERADQVDADDDLERLELVGAALADRPLGPADARAVHRDAQLARQLGGGVDGGLDLVGLRHVGLDELDAGAQLGGQRVALLGVDVGDGDLGALGVQAPRGRLTQPGGAADDQCSCSLDVHGAARYRLLS